MVHMMFLNLFQHKSNHASKQFRLCKKSPHISRYIFLPLNQHEPCEYLYPQYVYTLFHYMVA